MRHNGKTLVEGERVADAPALDAAVVGKVDLAAVSDAAPVVMVHLTLDDSRGKKIASFDQEMFLRVWRERETFFTSP